MDVDAFFLAVADEVNFLRARLADGDAVAATQEFQADDVLKCLVDGRCTLAVDGGAQAVVGEVVFFIDREDLLAREVLARDAVEEERLGAGGEVVENCLWRDGAVLAFEKFRDAARAERATDVRGCVAHDAREQVDIAHGVAFDDVFEHDAAVQVCEVLERSGLVVDVRKERHAAVREVAAPAGFA